jgi:signal transduction histidine kinase
LATTTQRHALAVLHRLATAVAHAESLEQIYDLAITALQSALGADRSAVLIRDASGTMQFEAWRGLSATFREAVSCHLPWPADDGAPAPLVVPDVQTSEAVAPRRAALVAEGIGSLAFIPVLGRGRLLGKFMVYFDRPRSLDEVELMTAQTIASHIGFAIERRQADARTGELLDREQRARRQEQALLAVMEAATSTLDLTEAMRRIARALARVLGANMVGAYMADAARAMLTPIAGYRVPRHLLEEFLAHPIPLRAHAALEEIWRTPRPVWSDDIPSHPLVDRDTVRRFPHQSDLFVPVVVDGEPIGGFFCIWWSARRRFADDELRLVAEMGRQAAIAVGRARVFRDAEAASRAKDDFLAMLGHELRNPLSVISTSVAILERAGDQSQAAVRSRLVIARQVRHLTDLVNDLLDMTRVTSGKIALARRPLDAAEVVRGCVATLAQAGKTRGHEIALAVEPAWVEGDETRLQQVITNLVLNAVKFTPPGGSITAGVRAEGDTVRLWVQDTGVGIAADVLPRVFDAFVQGQPASERSQGGLGLGLTLVHRLAQLHGGSVEAASGGPGHGATFTVRLPRVPPPAAVTASELAPPAFAPARHVLLVEDNPDGRGVLRALLELEGHDVEEAADGPGALERALARPPDVAVIDIGLPGLDGYEVARRLRKGPRGDEMVLIALTGYGQPKDRMRSAAAGFDAHLVKPVDDGLLLRTLATTRPPRL